MRKILLFAHLLAPALYCCNPVSKKDKVKTFIPGVYVRHYADEYTDSYDTLTIGTITADGSEGYSVVKKSRFEKVADDGTKSPGYELKKWTGVYDDQTNSIWLQQVGKSIWFDPAKNKLKMGTEPYEKIKK